MKSLHDPHIKNQELTTLPLTLTRGRDGEDHGGGSYQRESVGSDAVEGCCRPGVCVGQDRNQKRDSCGTSDAALKRELGPGFVTACVGVLAVSLGERHLLRLVAALAAGAAPKSSARQRSGREESLPADSLDHAGKSSTGWG
jgi:hypothetical protein